MLFLSTFIWCKFSKSNSNMSLKTGRKQSKEKTVYNLLFVAQLRFKYCVNCGWLNTLRSVHLQLFFNLNISSQHTFGESSPILSLVGFLWNHVKIKHERKLDSFANVSFYQKGNYIIFSWWSCWLHFYSVLLIVIAEHIELTYILNFTTIYIPVKMNEIWCNEK